MKSMGPTDRTNRVVLEPQITRAYWTRRRAWQGEKVDLVIETKYVKDGTPVKFQVRESEGGRGDEPVAELDKGYKVEKGRCVVSYELKWDKATLGKVLQLRGREMEFHFVAVIDSMALRKKSNELYVDLHRFALSH